MTLSPSFNEMMPVLVGVTDTSILRSVFFSYLGFSRKLGGFMLSSCSVVYLSPFSACWSFCYRACSSSLCLRILSTVRPKPLGRSDTDLALLRFLVLVADLLLFVVGLKVHSWSSFCSRSFLASYAACTNLERPYFYFL